MSSPGRYKMGTFARKTGLSAALLRAWERRHGLLDPERLESGHRLYTDVDLRVIEEVKQQLDAGRSIGEIALQGREALLSDAAAEADQEGEQAGYDEVCLEPLRRNVVRAARELDGDLLRRSLDEAFARLSPRMAIEQVVEPAARDIGQGWKDGEISVAGEHLVSSHLMFRLRHLVEATNDLGRERRPVLCACLPEETHEIGLLVVALRLASSGYHLVYLGAMVPLPDLALATERINPRAVCLSVTNAALLDKHAEDLAAYARRWGDSLGVHVGGIGVNGVQTALDQADVTLWSADKGMDQLVRHIGEDTYGSRSRPLS